MLLKLASKPGAGSSGKVKNARKALHYCMDKAVMIRAGGRTADEVIDEFAFQRKASHCRSKYQAHHSILSFRLRDECAEHDWNELMDTAELVAQQLYGDRDRVLAMHNDGAQIHVHIVANWTDRSGKGLNTQRFLLRGIAITAEIAKERGFIPVYADARKNTKLREKDIHSMSLSMRARRAITNAIKVSNGEMQKWEEELVRQGIGVEVLCHSKMEKAYGVIFFDISRPSQRIAGSRLGHKYSYPNLVKQLANISTIVAYRGGSERIVEEIISRVRAIPSPRMTDAGEITKWAEEQAFAVIDNDEYKNLDLPTRIMLRSRIERMLSERARLTNNQRVLFRALHNAIVASESQRFRNEGATPPGSKRRPTILMGL